MKRSTLPPPGTKRMNVNLDEQLLRQFKSAVALKGEDMTKVVTRLIEQYVRAGPANKKRRSR